MPLISVITVCLNSASTIENALQSVAAQDWLKVEHIIIDGGSTDETLKIVDRFKAQLSCVVSEPDKGIYDAMNKGLSLATGEIICFLNADDYYASSSILSTVANRMQADKLDALLGDVGFFDPKKPGRLVRRYRSDRFTPERLAWGWMPAHPALFLRRSVVQRVGLFNTKYRIAGDFEYIVRVFRNQSMRYIHISNLMVLMQVGGISTGGIRSKFILNKEVLMACRENGIKTNIFKILSKYPLKLIELICLR